MNENVASLISYLSGIGVMLMGLSFQEWFGLVGLITTILTFLVNLYYKDQTLKHQRAMRKSKEETGQ